MEGPKWGAYLADLRSPFNSSISFRVFRFSFFLSYDLLSSSTLGGFCGTGILLVLLIIT